MKSLVLVVSIILCLAIPVWACEVPVPDSTQQQQQKQLQHQRQNQIQLQGQDQDQVQNNEQVISPVQGVQIDVEGPRVNLPVSVPNIAPQMTFGKVKQIHSIPVDKRLKDWNGEIILAVVKQTTTTAGNAIKDTIDVVRSANQKEDLTKCRMVTLSHDSTKQWNSGGNVSFGGATTGGASGSLALWPTWSRMTADDKLDLIVVRVVD
ncbi:MAG: hypothetical protein EHM49_01260 [Deltaproteobacteria bacterium]|nr:MAG: hypothetical protein EHM49_01260 [Deltaproteobacteria bacterium]